MSDSSIYLTERQFDLWLKVEEDILSSFFNNFEIPPFFIDLQIPYSFVISFQYNNKEASIHNIKIHKQLNLIVRKLNENTSKYLINAAIAAFKKPTYNSTIHHLKESTKKDLFYLPINLEVNNVSELINQKGILRILATPPSFGE